ncbi:MAG: hypothetical protein Q8P71_01715 [bacterium]|nr:hypothetical protein [bacterium]
MMGGRGNIDKINEGSITLVRKGGSNVRCVDLLGSILEIPWLKERDVFQKIVFQGEVWTLQKAIHEALNALQQSQVEEHVALHIASGYELRVVIEEFYGPMPCSLKKISKKQGVTHQRVTRRMHMALTRLRHPDYQPVPLQFFCKRKDT